MVNINVIPKYILLLALDYTFVGASSGHWNYNKHGNDWEGICGTGKSQSPIALIKSQSQVFTLPPLNFGNYDLPMVDQLILTNNGHTAKLSFPPTSQSLPYISGGLLPNNYEAHSLHFHWGSPSSRGSEHVINDERYDVEMHIVHKSNRYATFEEARENIDGIAVLGIMLEVTDTLNDKVSALLDILNKISEIQTNGAQSTITGKLVLKNLISSLNTNEFYNYKGSLTTPKCAEAVTWFVFPHSILIPRAQISRLWNITDASDNPLLNNYRNLQQRNNRAVYYKS